MGKYGNQMSGSSEDIILIENENFYSEYIEMSWEAIHFVNCRFSGNTTFHAGEGMDEDGCYRMVFLEKCLITGQIDIFCEAEDTAILVHTGTP